MFGGAAKTPFGTGAFGSGTSAFGATASPFGQTSTAGGLFGNKTTSTGFGSASTFGSPTPGTNLFGASPSTGTPGTGLFGQQQTSSVFGQTPATQTGFGGFGTSAAGTSLFGNQTSTTSSLFQSPQTNTFANKSAFGSTGGSLFGTSTNTAGSMFGANQQQKSLFGGTGTAAATGTTGMFGATGFGGSTSVGTPVKFNPVKSADTMVKSGITTQVSTTHQCITVMKEYETKSLEELRAEDYQVGRKGPGQGGTTATAGTATAGIFSGNAATTASRGMFGTSTATNFGQTPALGTATSGFGTGTSMFGQQAQPQQATSVFGSKIGTSLFGNTATTSTGTTGFGGFGTPGASTGLFGGTTTTQAGGLFGAATSQPSTGLFGPVGTTTFGQTNTGTGLFGSSFGQTQPQAGSSLFGAKPATGFGATATGTTGFGTSAFGAAATGGLFGAQKPATSFGGFGAAGTNFGSGFGTSTSAASSLFGVAKPAGFGTANTFGGFGATPAAGTGLFGNTGTSAFGTGLTTSLGTTGLSTGLAGFGTQNNSALNLGLGQNNQAQALLQQQQQQQQMQQQLLALVAHSSPFGDNPLFRNRLANSAKTDRVSTTASDGAHKGISSPSHYKVSPRPSAKIKPRPINNNTLNKSKLFEGLDDDSSLNPETFVPRRSIKKLVIKSKTNGDDSSGSIDSSSIRLRSFDDADDLVAPTSPYPRSPKNSMTPVANTEEPQLDDTPGSEHTPIMGVRFSQPGKNMDCTLSELNVRQTVQNGAEHLDRDAYPLHVVLTRPEYFTVPPLEEINTIIDETGGAILNDFIVGREGYGMVKFFGETDVTGLNLDEIVFFIRREVEVYPDTYSQKPPVGEALNKRSEITLHKVWPADKTTHTPVRSPERLKLQRWREKVENATGKLGGIFIDYRPQSGTWVFIVEHFTRYGMQAEFVDDEADAAVKRQKRQAFVSHMEKENEEQEKIIKLKELALQQQEAMEKLKEKQRLVQQQLQDQPETSEPEQQIDMEDDSDMSETALDNSAPDISKETFPEAIDEEEVEDAVLPTVASHRLGNALGMDTQRIQVMKASFFGDEEDDAESQRVSQERLASRSVFSVSSSSSALRVTHIRQESPVPASSGRLLAPHAFTASPGRGLGASAGYTAAESRMMASRSVQHYPSLRPDFQQSSPQPSLLPSAIGGPMDKGLKVIGMKRKQAVVPLKDSLIDGKLGFIADAGLIMSRSFRVGWGPGWTLVHSGKIINHTSQETESEQETNTMPLFSKRLPSNNDNMGSPFRIVIEKLDICPDVPVDSPTILCPALEVQLKNSQITLDNGVPFIENCSDVKALHQLAFTARKQQEHANSDPMLKSMEHANLVWSLAVALWGRLSSDKLEDILKKDFEGEFMVEEENGPGSSYREQIARREALSQWLASAAAPYIKREVEKANFKDKNPVDAVFSLLSGKQISAACHLASQEGNTLLSVLIAQSAGNHITRQLIRKQLADWEEDKTDEFISKEHMKIYALLAGLMVWETASANVNTCESLDWKRALAVHLWYFSSPISSIHDALEAYEKAFKGHTDADKYAKLPLPPYLENSHTQSSNTETLKVKDLCYHLLKLYCKRPHRLEKALAPTSSTSNQLDYKLSWHVSQVLLSLGYTHLSEYHASLLHASFAAQLEAVGLWEWSVFVMLHLKNIQRRESLVRKLLCQHCSLSRSEDYIKKERFLLERLQVPAEWVHEAKALHAHYLGEHHEEAVNLLQSHHWNMSHVIIIKQLSSDAIINENYEYLGGLLDDLSVRERCSLIKNWSTGGQVFLDYLHLLDWFQSLKVGHNPSTDELEQVLHRVSSLIYRISSFPCSSAKDRLCQSDMAKMCSNFLKVVSKTLSLQEDSEEDESLPARMLAPHINKLPMPEDLALAELEELTNNYTAELTSI